MLGIYRWYTGRLISAEKLSREEIQETAAEALNISFPQAAIIDHLPLLKGIKLFYYLFQRSKGKPLAYISRRAYFLDDVYQVNPSVLIPRPETEQLLDQIFTRGLCREEGTALDIGTGSGCIAISLKKKYPSLEVWAADISRGALKTAERNAEKILGKNHGIRFILGDGFSAVYPEGKVFDLVVSNPPYIRSTEMRNLPDSVKKFEPKSALDGGERGLREIWRLKGNLSEILKKDGNLVLEIGYDQGEEVKITLNMFDNNTILKDYSGLDRIFLGIKYHGHSSQSS